ncbi:aldo/keto reductase [Pseudomonadales bacterium]|uniref:Aldo/keto reductase n=1 Tax=SAR86 cluster bacterium TaxID=2030880 RepID=A0A972VU45_9GAMM|nr:aldo/keto reductase [Pseudomonadales bacterium]MDB9866634.1 aldo/keto reductase [Pseudomonadales bacterium]MDC0174556.1 aldo/keto reductase [Pseudomonadales bacterium]NQV64309.1 aldo/keto reductase [SAR86 cluster bacterium]
MLKAVQMGRNTGLRVSSLCLGTMNFGQPGRGHQGDWTLGIDEARDIFKASIDHGLFYFDCADIYGVGACEEVVGKLLNELLPRDEYVLTTKVSMPMGAGANMGGLSRKHIMEGVDRSLKRLGHDYVDQLIIHRHPHGVPGQVRVPIEETLEALHDVVKAGKALYLGGSSMFAWQFAELQMTATQNNWTRFVSMQNHYNLIYREEEREMIPYCIDSGVAVTPWSPLARGILAGAYQGGFGGGSTKRSMGQDRARTEGLYRGANDFAIADRVVEMADKYGKTPAQIAIAWLMAKPGVVCPVVGVSKIKQLDDLVDAVSITLEAEDISYLEALYQPVENLLSLGAS